MTEYQREVKDRKERRASRRFMLIYTLACISAVVLVWFIFVKDSNPTQAEMDKFHERRDAEISDNS